MNRKQAEENVGELVRLDYWPPCANNTASCGIGDRWLLEKLTKGGMAVIKFCNDRNNFTTINVPPSYISELK